jgi:putative addiction module CopG family antidote
MTLQLPGDIERLIEDRVKSGEYATAQDVVRAGLRLLESHSKRGAQVDFQPGEWNQLLQEAEGGDEMTLDEVIEKRRAERASSRTAR